MSEQTIELLLDEVDALRAFIDRLQEFVYDQDAAIMDAFWFIENLRRAGIGQSD